MSGLAAIRLRTRVADALTDEAYILNAGRKASGQDFLALVQRARKAAPRGAAVEILSIVLHRSAEGLDAGGVMMRHGASADGPLLGQRALVRWTAGCGEVEAYDAVPGHGLAEHRPLASKVGRARVFRQPAADERRAALAHAGWNATIIEARDPSVSEDLLGITGVLSVRMQAGELATLGCGVYRGIPFAIPGTFPMPGALPAVPDEVRKTLEQYALARGLYLVEARRDRRGLAYLARASAGLVIVRLADGSPVAEVQGAETGNLTGGQSDWVDFQATHGGCLLLDTWHDGRDAVVVLQQPGGQTVRYGVDEDGVEVWARPYGEPCPYA